MPTALITGASSGIGLEMARLCAADHNDVVLVARRKERLEDLATELREKHAVKVTVLAADLAKPGSSRHITQELEKQGLSIDILVNNAGFGSFGLFVDTDEEKQTEMIEVNVLALTELTRLLVPGMIARHTGHVLNVGSTAAFQPGPMMAVYFATKAYVLSFSAALANELGGTGVSVTVLCPGPTKSGFQEVAFTKENGMFSGKLPSSAQVAAYGYRAMKKGRLIAIPGFKNKAGAYAGRFLPIKLVTNVVRAAQS